MSARSPRKKAIGKSMSSAAASRARKSATPGKGPGSPVQGPVFGMSSLGSLATFDHPTSSWKTSQRCLIEGWVRFSGRWPRSGMTRNGTLFQLRPLVRRTGGTASGSLPTPTADAAIGAVPTPEMAERFRSKGRSGSFVEAVAATMWPTPTAAGFDCADVPRLLQRREEVKAKGINGNVFGLTLGQAVKVAMWPTPTACQGHNQSSMNTGTAGCQMVAAKAETPEEATKMVGGQLNPTWVEWLMGFPLGWTDCAASEMP